MSLQNTVSTVGKESGVKNTETRKTEAKQSTAPSKKQKVIDSRRKEVNKRGEDQEKSISEVSVFGKCCWGLISHANLL